MSEGEKDFPSPSFKEDIRLPKQFARLFPIVTSLKSQQMICLIIIFSIIVTIEVIILLHLAWRSMKIKIPIRKSLLPSIILGIVVSLVRLLIPPPFHILINTVLLGIFVQMIGHPTIIRGISGTMFAEASVILGTLLLVEPLIGLDKHYFFSTFPGFCLGAASELVVPAIVLFIFIKYKLSLIKSLK